MPFQRSLIEAKLALHRFLPNELPELACEALEAGYDGPNLRRLSALDNPSGWETDRFLPGAKVEIGIRDIDRRTAGLRLAQELARQMLSGTVDILASLSRLERLWIDSDYPEELSSLSMLADEIEYSSAVVRTDFLSQTIGELEELAKLEL